MTPAVRPAPSVEPARHLLDAAAPWWDLVCFGPPGHEVYLRVRFDVEDEQVRTERRVLEVLAEHTTTPGRCWAAVWEGWTSRGTRPAAPVVDVPERRMLLFEASVDALHDLPSVAWRQAPYGNGPGPHLAWPDDRAWTFACDVDEEDELTVGCARAAADALVVAFGSQARIVAYGEDLST
ncbi:hypothetical protein [Nocardioides litoris]|uniref:hypothetical protein n=1 Tax=Nocardioides litoris TaxID=1926648 RepID=UPI001124AE89|nr:hypothetical protein [Nocardioides litoris]